MRLKAAALGLALAAAGACAQAAPMFDSYQGFCVKTHADGAASVAAATASGWTPIPDALLQQLSGAAGIEKADGRMRSDTDGLSFMFVGSKAMPVAGLSLDVRFCAVATSAALPAGELSNALAAWAAVPSDVTMSQKNQVGYVFVDEAGGHKPFRGSDAATVKAAVQAGHVRFAFVQEGKGINLLAFAVPTL